MVADERREGYFPLGSTNKNKGLGVIAWPFLFWVFLLGRRKDLREDLG